MLCFVLLVLGYVPVEKDRAGLLHKTKLSKTFWKVKILLRAAYPIHSAPPNDVCDENIVKNIAVISKESLRFPVWLGSSFPYN